jgi:hypothetical protein
MAKRKPKSAPKAEAFVACTPKQLPDDEVIPAAKTAVDINPVNQPPLALVHTLMTTMLAGGDLSVIPARIAVMTTKWWGAKGVDHGVGFMDNPPADLRAKILAHMNLCGKVANIRYREAAVSLAEVRIARWESSYYSYLGPDILHIPKGQPTMMLGNFTMRTPDSEFMRVVPHEAFHSCGCPHEHARKAIVSRLDPAKVIAAFGRSQGWSEAEIRQQILTPLEESSIMGTTSAEEDSIMTYSFGGNLTRDGKPIVGGTRITDSDHAFMARVYPRATQPPPPPPPTGERARVTIEYDEATNKFSIVS